jgi:UDP-N-acetylmuramyl-tripeptide synthetase
MTMRLQQLVEGVEEIEPWGELLEDPVIEDVVLDSRRVEPGSLFAALPGEQVDGHDFIDQAVEAGATAIFAQSDRRDAISAPIPIVWAEDTRRSLGPLSAHFFGHPSAELDVVGITGTNGKTTCCAILESLFQEAGRRVGVIGTVGYRWGDVEIEGANTTPESLLLQRLLRRMSDDGVDLVVMEVSSHALATHRMRGMAVETALFTNLSQDHLDFHGDMASFTSTFTATWPPTGRPRSGSLPTFFHGRRGRVRRGRRC